METVMERADREGMPCYLESSKGYPNVTIYEKMGFKLVKEIECVEGVDVCKVSWSWTRALSSCGLTKCYSCTA